MTNDQLTTELHVSRHATRIHPGYGRTETRPLADWRELDAYVLLGDPGAGKTTSFQEECRATGGHFVRALDVGVAAGNGETDFFIDGLDEVRAGVSDHHASFKEIRTWLVRKGNPRFRISCREADWRGASDVEGLRLVAARGEVVELHLEPLSEVDVRLLAYSRFDNTADAEHFLETVSLAGLSGLMENPLLLDLLIRASATGTLPRTRRDLYRAACSQLATEHNTEHRPQPLARPGQLDDVLRDAGLLCALLLLSGRRGVALDAPLSNGLELAEIPAALRVPEAQSACRSKLFAADARLLVPRHRTIAEHLAGLALASRIEAGLPLSRVMALIQGVDGRPVEPLRGVWAWLAVHSLTSRQRLVDIDPLGFVLNGDVAALSIPERRLLIDALRAEAERDPWFMRGVWVQQPFAPLAVPEMIDALRSLLRETKRDRAHESVVTCVLASLQTGNPMPELTAELETWLHDAQAPRSLRANAYLAWRRCTGFDHVRARQWLDAIRIGQMVDSDDGLCGLLLNHLYPEHLSPAEVVEYWHEPKDEREIGDYWWFWTEHLWTKTTSRHDELIDAWLENFPTFRETADDSYLTLTIRHRLLSEALLHQGDQITDERLYLWLGIVIDEFGSFRRGTRENLLGEWLAERPDRLKAILVLGLERVKPDKDGHWPFWRANQRLLEAKLPRDWFRWLLERAALAHVAACAKYCFEESARVALHTSSDFDISMEEVEAWVDTHVGRWHEARQWLQNAWSLPIDHWRADQHRRDATHKARSELVAETRRKAIAPLLPRLLDGSAPSKLMMDLAVAYERGFIELRGDSPLKRVQEFLGFDESKARAVVDALPLVLARTDLPSPDEELARDLKKHHHFLRPAALLAAKLVAEADSEAPLRWLQPLAERLWAYYLCDGTGNRPDWFNLLARERVQWMAPIWLRYAKGKLKERHKEHLHIVGAWALAHDEGYAALTRSVLPDILALVPFRASKPVRYMLNTQLLPALPLLARDLAQSIVRNRLQRKLDPAQRIAWLVADLPFRAAAAEELVHTVGKNQRRAVHVGFALRHQQVHSRADYSMAPSVMQRLLAILAPITKQESFRSGIVTEADERHDVVRGLLSALSNDPSHEARLSLLSLAAMSSMHGWHEEIQYRLRVQVASAREANFRMPELATVAMSLANLVPASPADLRAVVVEHLLDLHSELRGSDTFALRQFWREKSATRMPKIENECRDLLLDRLRPRLLPLGITIYSESRAAQDKRPDLRADSMLDGRAIHLPIEVKKEDHDELWTAWRHQLLALYAIDPAARGFGLYLVLWFGHEPRCSPDGSKPADAADLQAKLISHIPVEDRHRLQVLVLDLSWPVAAT